MARKGKIIVNNLNYNTTIDDIFSFFLQGGSISKCYILVNSKNESSGLAIIQYIDIDSAFKILQSHELVLDGHPLQIEKIHQKNLLLMLKESKLRAFENLDSDGNGPVGMDVVRALLSSRAKLKANVAIKNETTISPQTAVEEQTQSSDRRIGRSQSEPPISDSQNGLNSYNYPKNSSSSSISRQYSTDSSQLRSSSQHPPSSRGYRDYDSYYSPKRSPPMQPVRDVRMYDRDIERDCERPRDIDIDRERLIRDRERDRERKSDSYLAASDGYDVPYSQYSSYDIAARPPSADVHGSYNSSTASQPIYLHGQSSQQISQAIQSGSITPQSSVQVAQGISDSQSQQQLQYSQPSLASTHSTPLQQQYYAPDVMQVVQPSGYGLLISDLFGLRQGIPPMQNIPGSILSSGRGSDYEGIRRSESRDRDRDRDRERERERERDRDRDRDRRSKRDRDRDRDRERDRDRRDRERERERDRDRDRDHDRDRMYRRKRI